MKKDGISFVLSASDLVGHLNCRHLSSLDMAVAEGSKSKPKDWNPLLEVLWERGSVHEQDYVSHLEASGLDVVKIDGVDITEGTVDQTVAAMKKGSAVIVQGALSYDGWVGRTDILYRVEAPSDFGDWSYEVYDTKLARETKAGTILQLCLYSDLLTMAQGVQPEYMYVVTPWSDFEPQQYRYADYAAYFRKVKRGLKDYISSEDEDETYPDPKSHCDVCRWRSTCDQHRRDDDHLCLVAGISTVQINELKQHNVTTVKKLSELPLPLDWKPERGSALSYERIREQARLQIEARETGNKKYELLPVENGFGLTCIPEPSIGDIFLDLEGAFVGEHGLEYLFGYQFIDDSGELIYFGDWAFSRAEEKQAFEDFVDFVMARWEKFPDIHIYHYAPYEPGAMKRLMGRYATREEEIDQMLRAGLFVDLYTVTRQGIRASIESYSIKKLEPFYEFTRETDLSDANKALSVLQANLELDDIPSITEASKAVVLSYNKDDCHSTVYLRDWLEVLRTRLINDGVDVPRPEPGDGSPNETITDWLIKIRGLIEQLTAAVPVDPEERSAEQQAYWVLANILDWHRRELKAVWWEYFRLAELSAEDLLDERAGLSGLNYLDTVGGTAKCPIQRYSFSPQESELRGGEAINIYGGDKLGVIEAISIDDLTVDIKKRGDSASIHPNAVFAHKVIDTQVMADALVRIAEYVVANGMSGKGSYLAARDLLLKEAPRLNGDVIRPDGDTTLDAAIRLCGKLTEGYFPIQGPPGAGKTFTAAHMICEYIQQGKTVGITANSHKVIRNLINGAIESADELGIELQCCHKASEVEDPTHRLLIVRRNEDLLGALGSSVHVGGGTAWLWSREDAFEAVDVLFVDEAAQMSLANVLAVSQAAIALVLIGDPQQLDQPMQGSHPDGTDVSALNHILGDDQIISPDQGLFLEETWRLHPKICEFTSNLFYAGKLKSTKGLEQQVIKSGGPIHGFGLRYLPVEHNGNQNCSPEEAQVIGDLVKVILDCGATWTDRHGKDQVVTLNDILIITPYNAQVFEIDKHLPGAHIGTVDKFQGQEAPISIYSTASSSHADAPRGMEFLYSLNRLNVATSRAKCLTILVGSPLIFEAECHTPRQMKLANAFCSYVEMAEEITV
ncbi:MAG: TM0106 family RecB-like putative nuclease [Gammaproteobacteria bacterium]|nr:TM0106 family RecB-like putative nuclease [Gammaproteobacteria bacterium]